MEPRPRLLLFGAAPDSLAVQLEGAEVVTATDPASVAAQLRSGEFTAVVADPHALAGPLDALARDELVLAHINQGVALLDSHGIIIWSNDGLRRWCPLPPVGRHLFEAMTARAVASDDADPLAQALSGIPVKLRVQRPTPDDPFVDLFIRPVREPGGGPITKLVALVWNVTPEVEQQRKLDALHQAGRDLAGLDPTLLSEMNIPTRVELLKQNLRRYIRDLLHYDIIELRLLDRRTGELRPLLEDGMTPEAALRVLHAKPSDNGVTGFVAATGRSYLCPDTAADPLYLQGATGARSSMTVPIKIADEVVGTLNVESPRPNGFGADDLQFTELFSKEIAEALHTLDLLTAQQTCTVAQSIEAVNREIALPVDEVLGIAAVLLSQLAHREPTAAEGLRKILAATRTVKDNIAKVGREMSGAPQTLDLITVATPLNGKRVLVVDPDERVRKQAHQLIGRLGGTVETSTTAIEGLALLAGAPFDVVFLDIRPPDMGGYEAYRRLRDTRPGTRIAMTTGFGYDVAHSIVKARADGMQHVLFKPFRSDQVLKAVLDGRAGPSSEYGPS